MNLKAKPLKAADFAPYGSVIDTTGEPSFLINAGRCGRYHDLAQPTVSGEGGRVAISTGRSEGVSLPLEVPMLERHPLGSQAFVPTKSAEMVIVVAEDNNGTPINPVAFITAPGQGLQFNANTWHGVLAPLQDDAEFVIVDRVGPGNNLEEYFFETPYLVTD